MKKIEEKKLTDEEIAEHEEFTKKANAEIERLTEENKQYFAGNERLNKSCGIYQIKLEEQIKETYDNVHKAYKLEKRNTELQKQVDELKEERENMQAVVFGLEEEKRQWEERFKLELEIEKKWGKQQTKQAVKDTAKEICDLILEYWEKKQFVECDWLRVAIAEKYGVEVE
jgi:hypothetical protein